MMPEEHQRRGDAADALFRENEAPHRRDMTTGDDDVLAAPLSSLGLTTRLTNTLLSNGFSTVGDVVAKSELEIWQLHYLGPAILTEIRTRLSALGLALRPGPPLPKSKWKL